MSSLPHELDIAKSAARAAGEAVIKYFRTSLEVTLKEPGQPVTIADLEADALLRRILLTAFPDHGWLSEESEDEPDRLQRKRVWIVDSIDGTRSFIAGRPEFSISIGLAEHGVATVGVVYNPARDELFYAVRGGGAFVETAHEQARIRVGERHPRQRGEVTMLASRSEIEAGAFEEFRGEWLVKPVGSTAYKMARIGWSRGDVFLSRGPKQEWDVCAGSLIVAEAGGRVTDTAGEPLRFNRLEPAVQGILAANRDIHADVIRRLGELRHSAAPTATEKEG
ncbi:3'(2'),5'-bisphosphate nucleotidase CysQ [soil metagenome]